MKTVKVLITDRCCGKTTFARQNKNYIDLDFYNYHILELPNSEKILVYIFEQITEDENTVVMMNKGYARFFDVLKRNFNLDVICYIPEASEKSRDYRVNLEKQRDIEHIGVPRIKIIESVENSFIDRMIEFENWAKENHYKYTILKVGEFISDFENKQNESL